MYIDSVGGTSFIGLQISNAMKYCSGMITCEITGDCSSAATFIALSGNELILNKSTLLYFHNYSKQVEDSGLALKRYIEYTDRLMKSMFENIYKPFLSQEEIDYLRNDGEIYICEDDPSLEERMQRHFRND
jgi:ATP-dependent protease ClpP protease subunit